MKAFIFVALVASVAARSLDLETLRLLNKEKSLLNTPVVTKVTDDLLLKDQNKQIITGKQNLIDSTIYPVQDKTVFGGIYDNVVDTDRVLSLRELYTTELFKEYLNIPLFRQYIQYPSFQRFVQSVYFQRFWQLPAYQKYFYNPVLFYKYVYPIVQLFNTEYTLPTEVYGQTEDVLGLQTLVQNKNYLPYAYNYNRFTVPTTFQQQEGVNYKFLLEKLQKNLIPQQFVADVKTDVKVIPTTEQKVVVEPISNQIVVDEPKVVDVQVEQKIVPVTQVVDSVVLTETDVQLLKTLLQKNIITPEVYEAVIVGKINYVTVLRQVLARGQITADLLNQIVGRLQVVDTVVPVDQTVVLTQRHIVILKDLLQKNIITPEVYQSVLVGKVEFTTVIRQVLERRGLTSDLINLIISRLVQVDTTVVPVTTEQDVLLLKELLRQNVITSQIYQYVLVGKVDLFDILRQVIIRRDVIDSVYPVVDTTVVLNQRNIALLKDFVRQNIISQDIFEAVVLGKIEFTTVLRQVLEHRGITSDLITLFINRLVQVDFVYPGQDEVLIKGLLRQGVITPEIYQAYVFGQFDIYTILRQVLIRGQVVDTVFPYTTKVNYGTDFVNKYYGYNKFNTEIPTIRDTTFNTYNRFPIVA